jgi:hypothetical protein
MKAAKDQETEVIMNCDSCGHKKPNEHTCKLHKSGLPFRRTCRDWTALPEQCATCSNFVLTMKECELTRETKAADDTCGSWEPVPTKSKAVQQHSQLPEPPPQAAATAVVLAAFQGANGDLFWSSDGVVLSTATPEIWVVKLSSGKCHKLGEAVEVSDTKAALAKIRQEALAKLTLQERKVLGLAEK